VINRSEKDFLRDLHKRLRGDTELNWRDDCVVRPTRAGLLAYSMDRPERIRWTDDPVADARHFGRWSAGLVAGDVIASGAVPQGISFDVGHETFGEEEYFLAWVDGVLDVCGAYGMEYEGGNIGLGVDVCGMAYGFTQRPISRRGAAPGDQILVTWALGTGWAKRLMSKALEGSGGDHAAAEFFDFGLVREHQDRPWVNLDAFVEVWETGGVTSGMDLTDGLVEFAHEIADQTGHGVWLECPGEVSPWILLAADHLGVSAWSLMLEPGYDTPHAHGWTVRSTAVDAVIDILVRHGVPHVLVGSVVDTQGVNIGVDGRPVLAPRYWDDVFDGRGSEEKWREQIVRLTDG
jgi:thiamine monophosphate kinase